MIFDCRFSILGKTMNRKLVGFVVATAIMVSIHLADAQQLAKVPRIGFLSVAYEPSPFSEAFVGGLRELGYIEGRNIAIEYRHGEGRFDRIPELAAEMVHLKIDVIFARGLAPAKAAKDATRTIPIVTIATDPVRAGLVASLARPGGNVTGVVNLTWQELNEKWLELLKEIAPR